MDSSIAADIAALNRPWFDHPWFPELIQRANLSPAMDKLVRQFARNGYVILDPEIADETLERAARDMRTIPPASLELSSEMRLQNAWRNSAAIRSIATAPVILEALQAIYQRQPHPFQTLSFLCGSEQRTHSDTIHFGSIPHGFMAGVWVALEDIDEANGPLHYYPQSQKLPVYDLFDIGVTAFTQKTGFDNYTRYEDFVERMMVHEGLRRDEFHVKRGQALIWASNLFHGGTPIRDRTRSRLSQVTHYHFSGCLYYMPLLSDPGLGRLYVRNLLDIVTGEPIPQYYNGYRVTNPGEWPPRLDMYNGKRSPIEIAKRMLSDAGARASAARRMRDFVLRRR
jgi:hypothetical protein